MQLGDGNTVETAWSGLGVDQRVVANALYTSPVD